MTGQSPLGLPDEDDPTVVRIREAMTEHPHVVRDQVEQALATASALLDIDPVILGAGTDDAGWNEVLKVRLMLEPWLAAIHGTRMIAEDVRRRLREGGDGA